MESLSRAESILRSRWFLPVVAALVGLGLGLWLRPPPEIRYKEQVKIEYQTKVEYKDRIVEKVVEKIVEKVVKDIQVKYKTVTVTVEKPTGEKITTATTTVDTNSSTKTDAALTSDKEAVKVTDTTSTSSGKVEDKVEVVQAPALPQWKIKAGVGLGISGLTFPPVGAIVYEVGVERRILGPIWIGADVLTSGVGTLTLSMEF